MKKAIWCCSLTMMALSAQAQSTASDSTLQSTLQTLQLLLQELGRPQAAAYLGKVILWSLVGAVAGAALAIAAFFYFRKRGWYEAPWRYAKLIRNVLAVITVMACACWLGFAGFWQGLDSGAGTFMLESRIGKELLPWAGNAFADAALWLDKLVEHSVKVEAAEPGRNSEALEKAVEQDLKAFRAGQIEFNVTAFLARLDAVKPSTLLVQPMVEKIMETYPQIKDSIAETMLRRTLNTLAYYLAEKKLEQNIEKLIGSRAALIAEAGREGNPNSISYHELSPYLVRQIIVPTLLKPLHSLAHSQQIASGLLTVLTVSLPVVIFRIGRSRRGKNPGSTIPPQETNPKQDSPHQYA